MLIHRTTPSQASQSAPRSASPLVRAVVVGVEVQYSRPEGVLVFLGRPCGNAWAVACRLARQLGAKPVAVGL